LALGLILSLFNSSLIFEKTRRKNFKCLGGWPLPPLVKSSLIMASLIKRGSSLKPKKSTSFQEWASFKYLSL